MDIDFLRTTRAAIRDGNADLVMKLIGTSAERLNAESGFGPWLYYAAMNGKLDIVRRLIAVGMDVNAAKGTCGERAINPAASEGHLDVVKYLIGAGAKLDTDEPELNPLFDAIQGGHLAVVKLLVEKGIDYRVKYTGRQMKNMDALAFARAHGQTEIARYLASLK